MSINIHNRNNPKLLANKYPELSKYLYDSEDGYKYGGMSAHKIDWICPYCKNVVRQIPINKVTGRNRIPCKICSDGISYPNKFMRNFLIQLGEDFISEYSPTWIKPKRYDFYIPDRALIIEMDGALGHGNKSFCNNTDDSLSIDEYKDDVAKKHSIQVIRIDCKISEFEYIVKNIKISKLHDIFDLNKIDWKKCDRDSLSSYQIIVCNLWNEGNTISEILDKTKLSRTTIIKYLHRLNNLGYCQYDPDKQRFVSGKQNISCAYLKNRKSVICLENKMIFDSCKQAYEWLGYNVDGHSIQDNCKGITFSAGKHPVTKEKLHWMFLKDYECIKEGA